MIKPRTLSPISKLPLLTIEAVTIIYGESDPQLILETLQQFKAEALGYVSEVDSLWRSGATEDVTRHFHSLKTMAAMVGAEKMSRVCRVLEHQLRAKDMLEARRTYPLFEKIWLDTLKELDLHMLAPEGSSTDAK